MTVQLLNGENGKQRKGKGGEKMWKRKGKKRGKGKGKAKR
jgi:hypothetical protein